LSKNKIWTVGTLTYTATGLLALFGWLLWGDFSWAMKERAVNPVATLMVRSFGISDFAYGLLITGYTNFTNIFLQPIISYRSDRYRSKWGRRIPYLLKTTPFVVVGLIGLSLTPSLGGWLQNVIGPERISYNFSALIVFGVFWAVLDFGTTLTNAIFIALSNDVVPAALIGRFMGLFRGVSLLSAVIFNYFLLGHAEKYSKVIFMGLSILYGIGLLAMCLKVKEGEYPPPELPTEKAEGVIGAVKNYFSECFSLPYYRWVLSAYTLCILSVVPVNTYYIFYAQSLGMKMSQLGKVFALVFAIAFVTSYTMGSLADRFHPIRMGIISVASLSFILLIGGFFANTETSFSIVFVLQNIAIMSFNTLTASYGQRLYPKALFAQFNSAYLMLTGIGVTLIAPLTGKYLDLTGNHYNHVFIIGSAIGLAGVLSLIVVFRYYKKLGGDQNYLAPMPHPRGE
jgi:maltose/moltooligosaccharide transporter